MESQCRRWIEDLPWLKGEDGEENLYNLAYFPNFQVCVQWKREPKGPPNKKNIL